jgi:hypothetical protein
MTHYPGLRDALYRLSVNHQVSTNYSDSGRNANYWTGYGRPVVPRGIRCGGSSADEAGRLPLTSSSNWRTARAP